MKELDLETQKELKAISNACFDFIIFMKKAKTKRDLLEAGKTLSAINYSFLYIVKEHEQEAIEMIDDIEYLNEEEETGKE